MSKRWVRLLAVCASVVLAAVCSNAGASPVARETSVGGPTALDTVMRAPEDIAFDAEGDLYISEFFGDVVDRIDRAGTVTVAAGTGLPGFSGDGGPATEAMLHMPSGVLFRPNGDLVIADHRNDCIREVDGQGVITTVAGTCTRHGVKGDGGPATDARLDDPIGITLDAASNLYIADEQNARVRVVNPHGTIETFAGGGKIPVVGAPDGVRATQLRLSHTSYVVADGDGNVYISDFLANEVLRIDRHGRAVRVAGTGDLGGFSGDGGPATRAELDFPTGLALDDHGRLYISDADNNRIRMVDEHGVITTIAGTGPVGSGSGTYGGDGGPAIAAHLSAPAGLLFDRRGDLLIADQGNNCVRMLRPDGTITLVAGVPGS